jgi:hypothetical protein
MGVGTDVPAESPMFWRSPRNSWSQPFARRHEAGQHPIVAGIVVSMTAVPIFESRPVASSQASDPKSNPLRS